MKNRFALLLGLALSSAAFPAFGQNAPPPPGALATAATATPAGTSFTLPDGFTKRTAGTVTTISLPEPDTKIAIVEVGAAADASAAAAAAWRTYQPAAARKVRLLTPRPPRNGWDEAAVIAYETSPAEHASVQALARRKGDRWTVVIIDGKENTLEKRGGAISIALQSLRPAGYARESFAGKTAHKLDAARVAALTDFVRTAADQLKIPGIGFALIENDRIVYEGGVGVLEIGKPERVDARTKFMIASNTKSMATLLLARLVDEGKLKWDDPVTKVYPAFRLGSDATTAKTLVRHLVCACTGLPRKDFTWLFGATTATPASDTFLQLGLTEPTSAFGEAFQYNNLMASAAGYVGGYLVHPEMELGAAFDAAMDEKIFRPLGMRDTGFAMLRKLTGNVARPHGVDIDGQAVLLDQRYNESVAPYRPAGGAWSSPHDMILYIQNELRQGLLPDGTRLISAANVVARRARGVPIGEDRWYGMGLMENSSRGVAVIHHGGDLFGYHSEMFAIPSAGVGAVVLTNGDNGPAMRGAFLRRLLELMYDGQPEAVADVAVGAQRIEAERVADRKKLVVPVAAADRVSLAANYVSPDLGPLAVERDGAQLRFRAIAFTSDVATRRNDDGSLSYITVDPALIGLDFQPGVKDGKRILTTRDGQHVYVFTER